jgi:DNA-binding protein HU-beta
MNKSELIDAIAKKSGLSKVKSGEAVDAFVGAVTGALKTGDSVTLIGFGSFSTAKRAARVGRNPKTGKEIKIAATTTPKFKAGKALKEAVAKNK